MGSLAADILKYTDQVARFGTPERVLDALDAVAYEHCRLRVLGAMLMPIIYGPRGSSVVLGKTLFLHKSAPKGWWEDYAQLTARAPAPTASLARLSIGDFTLTEVTHMLEPLGQDRQSIDIHHKHGIRDMLGCPIAGRWLLAYWSKKVITLGLEQRAYLFLAATFAAIQLEKFQQPLAGRVPKGAGITARELAVLRALSVGLRPTEVAKHLELGTETVRTHIKKAEIKLGAATPEAACCAAIRLRLIP